MSDSRLDARSERSDWTDRLGRLASLIGSAVVLVAALGFPSATLQYFHLKIPLQFLNYDRALRAGVLPTFVLISLAVGLFGVGYLAARAARATRRSVLLGNVSMSINVVQGAFLIIFLILYFAMLLLIAAGAIVWVAFPFVWLARSFGLWVMFTALAVVLGAQLPFFWKRCKRMIAERRALKIGMQPTQNKAASGTDADQTAAAAANLEFGFPFSGLVAGLMVGGIIIGALFTLRWASQYWFNLKLFSFLSNLLILITGSAFSVAVFAAFFRGYSAFSFSSHYRRRRLLVRAELVVTGILIYAFFSWLYADHIYTAVPQFLGGGRPDSVIAAISISNSSLDLSAALPSARCSRNGGDWLC